ncbi:MAG TPA: ATP-binding protein [Anaeromyxobacter sp.]
MKIERKIVLSSVFNVALIVLTGFFAFQNMNRVLAKLRFVEIADDLGASFLEMRLSEKNFFLYGDATALDRIRAQLEELRRSVQSAREEIALAVGPADVRRLEGLLDGYSRAVEEAARRGSADPQAESLVRAEGKRLKEFSETLTRLERRRVNDLILASQRVLAWSFAVILLVGVLVSHFLSQRIVRSVREVEKLARSISQGNYDRIEGRRANDEVGAVIGAVNAMSAELRGREEQLVQSRKLASLGILTAGVAHELTNPLNNISMIAQTYADVYGSLGDADRLSLMARVETETERIRDIVKNLLDFSRSKEPRLAEADANEIARRSVKLVQNILDLSNIDTRLELAEGLPHVAVDEHQIRQVLVNLLTNAAQAVEPGGHVVVSTRSIHGGKTVEIGVGDDGKGIQPEHLPHVFDPFFSTKGEAGTGLGLSVSYGIVKNHGGEIRVESAPGAGTTFTIALPVGDRDGTHPDHGHRR